MIHTRLGQPAVGSPKMIVLAMIMIIIMKEIIQKRIPAIELIAKGAVEKATIPSIAYRNNFQNDHFVSPATHSTFSYSSHLVLYPTN